MSSFDTIRKLIHERFATNWTTTAIAWPNSPFDLKKQVDTAGKKKAWTRITIIDDSANNVGLGGKAQRFTGVVMIQVFVGENTDTGTARQYADTISTIFKNVQVLALTFRVPAIKEIGLRNHWYQVNVNIPFSYDEII